MQPQLTPRLSVHPGDSSGPDTPGAKRRPSRQPTHMLPCHIQGHMHTLGTATWGTRDPELPPSIPEPGDTHTQAWHGTSTLI